MSNPSTGLTAQQQAVEDAARALFDANRGLNFGPWIVGFMFDFVLFGVMSHQLMLWWSFGHKERLFVKILLGWSILAATANTCFGLALMFHLFVYGFGHYSNFVELELWGWYTILDPFVVCAVQLFYAERAYRLNDKKIWIPISLVGLALASAAGDFAAKIVSEKSSLAGITAIGPYFYVWFGTELAGDLLLTVMMVIGLRRSRTGWRNTDRLVNRLMRLSVETQLPCTLVAIAILITWSVSPRGYLSFFWELWHAKTHVCAFLAVLNTQFSLREQFATSGEDSVHKRANKYPLRAYTMHQATVDFEGVKIDTSTYTEEHRVVGLPVGLNRQHVLGGSDAPSEGTSAEEAEEVEEAERETESQVLPGRSDLGPS